MVTAAPTQPASFPEAWDAPVEGNGTYLYDPMHFPHPISPLTSSAHGPAFAAGFTRAAQELQIPIKQVYVTTRNGYRFEWHEMVEPTSEEDARQAGQATEALIKSEIERLLERWNEEHLPAVQKLNDRLRAITVESMPLQALVAVLDEIESIHQELWTVHFRIAIPMLVGIQLFDEFYADIFGGEEGDGHSMLVGVASESVKAGLGLYDLAVRANELGLESVFRDTPSNELLDALEQTEPGRALIAELRGFLNVYGLRQDLFDLMTPTWNEDPTFALSSIRNYILSGRDARAEYAAMQQSAADALAAARTQLAAYPEAVRGQFEALLPLARAGSFMQEEHNFYIDQQGLALVRLAYKRVGDRLADAGILSKPDDVFMLHTDDMRELLAQADPAGQRDRVRSLVESRLQQFERAHTLIPPPFIGSPPAGPPPDDNPVMRANGRFFGGPPKESEHPNELRGNAGSRGVVSGRAFVARTLEEANELQPGEILVAVTTMPAWTPLFGVASAIVTETGGPLSHCAIVAREYGIPAVVGAHGATRTIKPGQQITVDGGRGIVTIDV